MHVGTTARTAKRRACSWTLPLACLCGALAASCARPHATALPDGPPLEVPPAPPREVVVSGTEVPPLVPLPEAPARPPVRSRPSPPRAEPKADVGKTDPPRAEPAAPPEPTRAEDVPRPGTTLQTTPAAEQSAVERGVRTTLGRAASDLNRIDYRALNASARTQYDTAKRFIQQAEEAIRSQNLVLARSLADKAAAIAAQQAGR